MLSNLLSAIDLFDCDLECALMRLGWKLRQPEQLSFRLFCGQHLSQRLFSFYSRAATGSCLPTTALTLVLFSNW